MKIELDLQSPASAQHLADELRRNGLSIFAGQIEAQLPKPRIPEPGLWAIVEAGVKQHEERLKWVRLDRDWMPNTLDEYCRPWSELIDPVLIREGI